MNEEVKPDETRPVILYDGLCNFCISVVNFVLKKDKQQVFVFSALQSKAARAMLRKHDEAFVNLKTVYLIKDGQSYKRSKAVFEIFKTLGYPWRMLSWLSVLPTAITDAGYKLVAKYRYKIFGQRTEFEKPAPEISNRFIS